MSSRDSASKAAEMAARQVEQIVEAAQLASEQIKLDAGKKAEDRRAAVEAELAKQRAAIEGEIKKLRDDATAAAEKERSEAAAEAKKVRDEALKEAAELGKQSETEAAERVAVAEKAADEALADARAISSGLRRLGQSLEDYAERILRDVQAGHRRLRGDLRIAGGGPPATPGERARRATGGEDDVAPTPRPPRSGRRGANPFEEIDVPAWVEKDA
ncbi:MAG: hypothetical protein QOI48_3305 [Solirubrobacteraceae bacterium]|nr:hypothetical protein [Solirubrobacteraceae bacterium]